jgi:hypothetical protein
MKQTSWTDFIKYIKTDADAILDGPCREVVGADGQLLFTTIIRPEQAMRVRVAGIASQIDASRDR